MLGAAPSSFHAFSSLPRLWPIEYHDGEHCPLLVRVDGTPDLLDEILKPLIPTPAAKADAAR